MPMLRIFFKCPFQSYRIKTRQRMWMKIHHHWGKFFLKANNKKKKKTNVIRVSTSRITQESHLFLKKCSFLKYLLFYYLFSYDYFISDFLQIKTTKGLTVNIWRKISSSKIIHKRKKNQWRKAYENSEWRRTM